MSLQDEVNAWRARFPAYEYRPQDDCVSLKNPPAPECCVCGTTENLYKDGWYGYRCRSSDCVTF